MGYLTVFLLIAGAFVAGSTVAAAAIYWLFKDAIRLPW